MVSKPSQPHIEKFLAPISTLKPGTMLRYTLTSYPHHVPVSPEQNGLLFPYCTCPITCSGTIKITPFLKKIFADSLWFGFFQLLPRLWICCQGSVTLLIQTLLIDLGTRRNESVTPCSNYQAAGLLHFSIWESSICHMFQTTVIMKSYLLCLTHAQVPR